MRHTYSKEFYDSIYDKDFIARQQKMLEDYLSGLRVLRINYILQFMQYIKGKNVLDLGCGVGTFAIILARQGYRTVGVDISENSINKCIENTKTFDAAGAKFILGDCAQDRFRKESFDAIIAADIVEHLPQPVLKQTIENCYRWLRPGGTCIIHTFPARYYYLLLGKRIFLLLLLYVLPRFLTQLYISCVAGMVNLVWLLRKGRTYDQDIVLGGHPNPQHPLKFKKLLEETGFEILEYKIMEEVLTDLPEDMPRYGWYKYMIERYEIIRPAVMAVVRKRAGT